MCFVFPELSQRWTHNARSKRTMTTTIVRKHTTLAFGHVCDLLRHTCERETRVSRAMVADHDRPVFKLGRSVVHTDVEIGS